MLTRKFTCTNAHNRRYGPDAVRVTAPTGIAAAVNAGTTLHSFFELGCDSKGKLSELKQATIASMCTRLQPLQHLFMDEYSMVSAEILLLCSRRYKTVCSELPGFDPHKLFGGLVFIVFIGCPCQLPSIGGNPLGLSDAGGAGQAFLEGVIDFGAVYVNPPPFVYGDTWPSVN
jgi:hypothetical protein